MERSGGGMAPATPNVRPSFASSAGETSDTPHVPGRNHARLVAEIAREFRPRLDTEGFSAVRELGSQLNARGVESNDDAPAHTHKRCKMCGNVCHARMNSCSSCCLPFVDRGSWEPATMPRPGGDVHSETDSDADSDSDSDSDDETEVDHVTEPTAPAVDAASAMERRRRERRAAAAVASGEPVGGPVASDSADTPTRPGWHDWFNRADRLREAPTHERGLDPALERSYAALGTALGATEAEVRIAYRKCVRRVHPDSGGSPKQLARVHDALEAIDRDAWSHGEGAAALREELSSSVEPVSTEMGAKKPRVFVSLAVYRDPEGLHTLKDAFDRASDPSRIFAGVHWQHVLAKPSGEEPVVDRLHPAQNMFTRQVEANLGKIQGDEDKVQYLKESMKQQGDNQRELDEKEARWHAKASLDATDGTKWEWAGHVRETRESWECAEGPCRARHMSMRLWGGEEYVLHADSRTRFDHGWDDVLIAELERIQALTNNPAVLTGVPLGYHMRMTPVDNPETYERVGYIPVYGRDEEREHELSNLVVPLRRDRTDDAPSIAAMGICGFGDLLCYPAAVRLAGYDADDADAPPLPAMLVNPSFVFAPAKALVADAPPDLHAPFLYLGEEIITSARLWTKGWRTYLPRHCPLRVCYDPRNRIDETREDKRRGAQLYDHPRSEAARGTWDQLEERYFMNLQSRRRVLQVIGAPDPDSATRDPRDAVILKEPWAPGPVRPVKEFVKSLGVDFDEREVSNTSRWAGLDRDALNMTHDTRAVKKRDTFAARTDATELGDDVLADDGLPLTWKNGNPFFGGLSAGYYERTERWS